MKTRKAVFIGSASKSEERKKSARRWRGERKECLAIESLFVQTPPVTVTGERSEQDTLTQLHTRYSQSSSSQKGGKV